MIRETVTGDADNIKVQSAQAFYKGYISSMINQGATENTFTYIENGVIKACIGMQLYWSGRAAAWTIIGDIENWTAFHRAVCAKMESLSKELSLHRLEMTTESGFIESERWAKMLGFEFESTMVKFGMDGKDHKMWVKTWQQQYHS